MKQQVPANAGSVSWVQEMQRTNENPASAKRHDEQVSPIGGVAEADLSPHEPPACVTGPMRWDGMHRDGVGAALLAQVLLVGGGMGCGRMGWVLPCWLRSCRLVVGWDEVRWDGCSHIGSSPAGVWRGGMRWDEMEWNGTGWD